MKKLNATTEIMNAFALVRSYIDGIAPERLQEICEAEREGRLVVLPVPIGSPIYVIVPEATDVDGNPIPAEIDEQHLSGYIKEGVREFYITYDPDCDILADNAYFTREEAEAALRGNEHE